MIRTKYTTILADLDERGCRRWAAAEAMAIGYGGITTVSRATGLSDRTIRNGIRELNSGECPRTRLWRVELQKLANTTGLVIEVCHYPRGTSKWNKIEHKLFCHNTRNWRGVPLETFEIVVNLISGPTTETGLEVHAWLDTNTYETKKQVSDAELSEVNITRNRFHGEWNYEIHPKQKHKLR